jgi:hypothetical protein
LPRAAGRVSDAGVPRAPQAGHGHHHKRRLRVRSAARDAERSSASARHIPTGDPTRCRHCCSTVLHGARVCLFAEILTRRSQGDPTNKAAIEAALSLLLGALLPPPRMLSVCCLCARHPDSARTDDRWRDRPEAYLAVSEHIYGGPERGGMAGLRGWGDLPVSRIQVSLRH